MIATGVRPAAALVVVLLAAGCGTSMRAPWRMSDLPKPKGWSDCVPELLNDRNQIAGTCSDPQGEHPFFWRGSRVVPIGPPGTRWRMWLTALNRRGDVVGYRWTREDAHADPIDERAFVWSNGTLTDLGRGDAYAVNDAGVVAGDANGRAALWHDGRRTLIAPPGTWAAAIDSRGEVVVNRANAPGRAWLRREGVLVPIGGRGLGAWSINDRGSVLGGCSADRPCARSPFVWRRGRLTFLSQVDYRNGRAIVMNARDEIASTSTQDPGFHAVLWRAGKVVDLGTLGDDRQSSADDLSDDGTVVGVSGNLENLEPERHRAFVWENGTMTELPAPAAFQATPVAVNDRDLIVGTIVDKTGAHGVEWTRRAN